MFGKKQKAETKEKVTTESKKGITDFKKLKKDVDIKKEDIKQQEIKKQVSRLKMGGMISLVIMIAGVIGAAATIMIRAGSLEPDETILSFIYILGTGWMFAMVMAVPLIIARTEVWNKLKMFGKKSKVLIVRMIGGDANEKEITVPLKGNTIEIGENKIIVNPRKATMKDGVRVLTYVSDNALAHDYFQDPNKTLKQIGQDLAKNKDENFHDIYSDPIRIDAKYFSETFLAAQQTNPDILKNIIAFLTSKNVLGMLGIIAIAAAISAVLGLQANNLLNTIPFCNPTTITP